MVPFRRDSASTGEEKPTRGPSRSRSISVPSPVPRPANPTAGSTSSEAVLKVGIQPLASRRLSTPCRLVIRNGAWATQLLGAALS